jgi:drug/metabolite transporter (DMT)-like permease
MTDGAPGRLAAVAIGLFVTFLWASSWVLIRIGLDEEQLDPIGFAGMRYGLAALVLLPLAVPALRRARIRTVDRRTIGGALLYGVVLFGIAQATQYVALDRLPAATVGLFMAMAPVGAVLLTLRARHEAAGPGQLAGIAILVVGVVAYFGLQRPPEDALLGIIAAAVMTVAVAWTAVLGRAQALAAAAFGGIIGMTAVAMLAGASATIATALVLEGVPALTSRAWIIVGWLAVVHTALGFVLWNHGLRTLRAVEASALGDLTVVQIAFLAWFLLGERLEPVQVVGLALALVGVAVVQLAPTWRRRRAVAEPPPA